MLPAKLGAKDEEEGGKPAVVVAIGKSKMPAKLGEDPGAGEDDSEEELDPEQAMKDATAEIISCLGGSTQSARRLKAALEAFCRACDAKEDKEEGTTEETE